MLIPRLPHVPAAVSYHNTVLRPNIYPAAETDLATTEPQGTTLESLTAEHARATIDYRASRMYRNTAEIFQQTVLQQSRLRVSSCICLCLGSLSGPPEDKSEDPENKEILSQLVGFEGIIHLLS